MMLVVILAMIQISLSKNNKKQVEDTNFQLQIIEKDIGNNQTRIAFVNEQNEYYYPQIQEEKNGQLKAIPDNLINKNDHFDLFYLTQNQNATMFDTEIETYQEYRYVIKMFKPKYFHKHLNHLENLFFLDKNQILSKYQIQTVNFSNESKSRIQLKKSQTLKNQVVFLVYDRLDGNLNNFFQSKNYLELDETLRFLVKLTLVQKVLKLGHYLQDLKYHHGHITLDNILYTIDNENDLILLYLGDPEQMTPYAKSKPQLQKDQQNSLCDLKDPDCIYKGDFSLDLTQLTSIAFQILTGKNIKEAYLEWYDDQSDGIFFKKDFDEINQNENTTSSEIIINESRMASDLSDQFIKAIGYPLTHDELFEKVSDVFVKVDETFQMLIYNIENFSADQDVDFDLINDNFEEAISKYIETWIYINLNKEELDEYFHENFDLDKKKSKHQITTPLQQSFDNIQDLLSKFDEQSINQKKRALKLLKNDDMKIFKQYTKNYENELSNNSKSKKLRKLRNQNKSILDQPSKTLDIINDELQDMLEKDNYLKKLNSKDEKKLQQRLQQQDRFFDFYLQDVKNLQQ